MAATIKDLARETGLGVATVSAYLNGVNVRPENKKALDNAVEKLGYVRNEYARALKLNKSGNVGVVCTNLADAFCALAVTEVQSVLRDRGFGALICVCEDTFSDSDAAFLKAKMCDAIIYIHSQQGKKTPAALSSAGVPFAVIRRPGNGNSQSAAELSLAAVEELTGSTLPEPRREEKPVQTPKREKKSGQTAGIRCEVKGFLD